MPKKPGNIDSGNYRYSWKILVWKHGGNKLNS